MNAEQLKNRSLELSGVPTEEKTVMFIENYYNGARGVISEIFRSYLEGPLYKDYRFVWVARDYEETLKIYGSLLDDSRIWICVTNGHDYVRFLNTAKFIFTAVYLPSFFIKRDDQVVYYAPFDIFINKKTYVKSMLWRLNPTLNNADHIIIEENSFNAGDFAYRFGISDKVRMMKPVCREGDGSDDKKKKTVYVSLMDKQRGTKNYGIFQYVYETITSLTEAYGFEAYWKVSLDYYRKYREDEISLIAFKNIFSGEDDCRFLLENADIIISDNYTGVVTADKFCENIIFFYNENTEYDELITKNKVFCTSDYARMLDLFEMKLRGEDTIKDTVDMDKVPVLLDCPPELCGDSSFHVVERSPSDSERKSINIDKRKKILIVMETAGTDITVKKLHEELTKYLKDMHITVFFVTGAKGTLYKQTDDMVTDISYICRAGVIRCTPAERKAVIGEIDRNMRQTDPVYYNRLEKVLRDEWIRCIGKTEYDVAVIMSGMSKFWDNMINVCPSDETFIFKKSETEKIFDILEHIY